MPVIQRIRSAASPETAELYTRGFAGGDFANLPPDTLLSFNTYFNSFHEASYVRHCDFGELSYEFRLKGDFKIRLIRAPLDEGANADVGKDASPREIASGEFTDCASEVPVRMVIPPGDNPGRVYAEVTCLSAGGTFAGGDLIAAKDAVRSVQLAIVICTFRKEEFVAKTVAALTADPALREKEIAVYIADNAGTLKHEMFPDERVHLLPGKNAGGAGGFTRGLLQAYENSSATHFLVMDDDVELETESILRLITFQEYASNNPAVAGAMLNLSEKTRLVTAGSDLDIAQETGERALFSIRVLRANADLERPETLSRLNAGDEFDFGGFWFFAFDRDVLRELAFPLPFFIKGDDAEFGIRTSEMREIIALPGVCVWHEPPERKPLTWEIYYHYRNMLVMHDLHRRYGTLQSLIPLAKYFLHGLFTFRYNFCELMLRALRDYRRGPEYLAGLDPETVHGEIRALANKHAGGTPIQGEDAGQRAVVPSRGGLARMLFALWTMGGHVWPSFLGSRGGPPRLEREIKWYSIFPAREYTARTEFAGDLSYRKRSLTGIALGLRFAGHLAVLLFRRGALTRRWREGRKHLSSAASWKKYLGLEGTK